MSSVLRTLDPADAEPLAALWTQNRAHLEPWSPARKPRFFTVEGQLEVLERRLLAMADGRGTFFVITDAGGDVVGELNLTDIVHGAFENGHVGYWVSAAAEGQGLVTRA